MAARWSYIRAVTDKLGAVIKLLVSDGPEKHVSKRWLFRTGSKLDRRFKSRTSFSVEQTGDFQQVTVNGQIFLWPRNSDVQGLLQILSEVMTPYHPHQYLFGPTDIEPNDVVLDIGACEGAFSALATDRCKRVIAIEPSRTMSQLIAELFHVRQQVCPQILNCLLGSESSKAYFVENVKNPGASRISNHPVPEAYELQILTLDEAVDLMEQKPTFIKCDAEGAELGIFSGGKKFLTDFHPKLAITTYHTDHDFRALHDLLKSLDYRVMGKGFLYSQGTLRVQMIHAW